MGIFYDNDIRGFAIRNRDSDDDIYHLEFTVITETIVQEIMTNMSKYNYMIHYLIVYTGCSDTYDVAAMTSYFGWREINRIELMRILVTFLGDNDLKRSMETMLENYVYDY